MPSWQKSVRSGKSVVLPSLTNQALTRLIWQAVHGLHGNTDLISASLNSDEQFNRIFGRIQASGITYGSDPYDLENGRINHKYGGRGVYFKGPNGHVLEIITADYIID